MASHKHESIINLKDRTLFDVIAREILKYGEVKITGLGVFKLKKSARFNKMVQGLGVKVKNKISIKFIPTKTLKVKMQKYHGK